MQTGCFFRVVGYSYPNPVTSGLPSLGNNRQGAGNGEANRDQNDKSRPSGASKAYFRSVSCHMHRMLQAPSLRENQDGFVTAAHNGSSEEWHHHCPEDAWFRPPRSSASPPRRGELGYAERAPHAFVPWLAVHAGDLCNRGVRS